MVLRRFVLGIESSECFVKTGAMRILIRTLIIFMLAVYGLKSSGQTIILGVLEDFPGNPPEDPGHRSVRVVFRKNGNQWQPYSSDCSDPECLKKVRAEYPAEMDWTIAFDGRKLGQLSSRTPEQFESYSSLGEQLITSAGPVPTIGKRSSDFGTFLNETAYRPLVAVSQPYFKDPDVWKPAHLSSVQVAVVRQVFRRKYPKLCSVDEKTEVDIRPFQYRDHDIKVRKMFSSKGGWSLIELYIKGVECDDAETGFNLYNQWFVMNPQGRVQFLGEGMWLVEAGDYDNDGRSEIMFCIDQYNLGGYRLFYDDFKKTAISEFHYH
jgi:hypothetical protein